MKKRFGDYLRELRQEKGLTQQELADLLGTTKQVISKYETSQRTPKITIAEEYAKKLDVPLNYLLKGDVNEDSKHSVVLFQHGKTITYDDLPEEGQKELENYLQYLRQKYPSGN